tara:strand:- start:76 stop:246 length:171 start_codon:yes stop_codon:yes gene_type:complete
MSFTADTKVSDLGHKPIIAIASTLVTSQKNIGTLFKKKKKKKKKKKRKKRTCKREY